MTTFLLIPGAGADSRVYAATIEALEDLGHRGIAPELPLTDQAAGPSDHAAAAVDATPREDGVVVVAQSLGAFAGPIAAERLGAAALILIAPMIPAPGETAGEWWQDTGHEEAIADLRSRYGPMSEWEPEAIEHVFLHDVDPEVARESERFQGPPGIGMFTEPSPLTAWPEVETRVIAPTDDRLFPLEFQRRVTRERLGLEVEEIDGGHLPMLSRPRALAESLVAPSRP